MKLLSRNTVSVLLVLLATVFLLFTINSFAKSSSKRISEGTLDKIKIINLSPEAGETLYESLREIQEGNLSLNKIPGKEKAAGEKMTSVHKRILKRRGQQYALSTIPDFDFACMETTCFSGVCPFEPGGEKGTVSFADWSNMVPPNQFPKEVKVTRFDYKWSDPNYGLRADEMIEAREDGRCTAIDGARTITMDHKFSFDLTAMPSGSGMPSKTRARASDGSVWDIYDADVIFLVEINPDEEVLEINRTNNQAVFRWIGYDNIDTEGVEVPPGLYSYGYWN